MPNLVLLLVQSCLFANKVQDSIAFREHRKDCTMVNEFAIGSKKLLSQHSCQLLSFILGFVFPTTPLAYI